MKKLGKLKLRNAMVMSPAEMKLIAGGGGGYDDVDIPCNHQSTILIVS